MCGWQRWHSRTTVSSVAPGTTISPTFMRRVAERRPDHDAVLLVHERITLHAAAAKAPVAIVVLEDEGNRVGDARMHVEVSQQFLARHDALERKRVRDDVEGMVRVGEQPAPVHRLQPRFAAGPLFGHDPGPRSHARRVFVDRHRNLRREGLQRGVVAVRQDVAGQLPQRFDDPAHVGVGRQRRGGGRARRPRFLDRDGIARRTLRREPRVAGELAGGELEVLLGVDGDQLARTDRSGAADPRLARERLERRTVRITVGRGDPDVVDPAFLALEAVLADPAREELVEAPRNAGSPIPRSGERSLRRGRLRGCRSCRRTPRSRAWTLSSPRQTEGTFAEQLLGSRADARVGKDRIPGPDRPRQLSQEFRERRERVPQTGHGRPLRPDRTPAGGRTKRCTSER